MIATGNEKPLNILGMRVVTMFLIICLITYLNNLDNGEHTEDL